MAKMTRERAVKEKRARKQEKKEERKAAAAEAAAAEVAAAENPEAVDGSEPAEGLGDEGAPAETNLRPAGGE